MKTYIKAVTVPSKGAELIGDTSTDNAHTWSAEKLQEINSWSSEEIDTGAVWCDNKKIYKRCYHITVNSLGNNEAVITHNIGTSNTIINWDGIVLVPQHNYSFKLDGAWTNYTSEMGEWQAVSYCSNTYMRIRYGSAIREQSNTEVYVTIYYVKN